MKERSLSLFSHHPAVIGVVHLLPLPGSPGWQGDLEQVKQAAVRDAVAMAAGGIDGIIVENFWDAPFTKGRVNPVTVAAMTCCVEEIRRRVDVCLGVNVLRNDGVAALSIAAVTGARFIRVNVYSYPMVTDQGIIEGCAYEVSRLKKELGADVRIMADIMVKHAFPLGAMDICTVARDTALRGGVDALIISGAETGAPINIEELKKVRQALPDFPLASGSGVTEDNVRELLKYLDVLIIGTWFKEEGDIRRPVVEERVKRMVDLLRSDFC